ncbi:MAG: 23S rRNA (pseudouridine(1915)-N(3))-methyltransferase RlmH, partial [Bauldia sp.]
MLITIATIGKLKTGPERELFDHFLARAAAPGRKIGLTFTERAFRTQEASALLTAVPAGAFLVTLDEAGTSMTSNAFADRLGKWRDDGAAGIVFAI